MKTKFSVEKITGVLGITQVHHLLTHKGEKPDVLEEGFQIWADGFGVRFKGTSPHFSDREGLDALAKAVSEAYRFYEIHRSKITNAAGH